MNDRVETNLKNLKVLTPSLEIKLSDSDAKGQNSSHLQIDQEIKNIDKHLKN